MCDAGRTLWTGGRASGCTAGRVHPRPSSRTFPTTSLSTLIRTHPHSHPRIHPRCLPTHTHMHARVNKTWLLELGGQPTQRCPRHQHALAARPPAHPHPPTHHAALDDVDRGAADDGKEAGAQARGDVAVHVVIENAAPVGQHRKRSHVELNHEVFSRGRLGALGKPGVPVHQRALHHRQLPSSCRASAFPLQYLEKHPSTPPYDSAASLLTHLISDSLI